MNTAGQDQDKNLIGDRLPRLVVIEPAERAGMIFALGKPQLVIGHSDSADILLEDRYVSRRHALVTVDLAGQVTIRDLNSTGGTFVNEERLDGPRVLWAGDTVRFADLVARFEPGGPPAAAEAFPADAPTRAMPVLISTGAPVTTASVGATDAGEPPSEAGTGGSGASAGAGPEATAGTSYTVTGTALSPALPGVGGLIVQLVDKNVGGDQVLASTQTASNGSYSFSQLISARYLADHHKASPDLQVQALARGSVVATSEVSYSAPDTVSLDVVLPANAAGLPSEYETLAANLAAVYPGSLGALQENTSRQDITYLANKTGWDARAVTLAALADQFSQITASAQTTVTTADPAQTAAWPVPTVSIQPEFYYALFRAGLPANTDSLFQASPATVKAIWEQAVSGSVIPQALAKEVPTATAAFQTISASRSLDAAPAAGLSTLREMLATTLPAAAQQDQFAQLYTQYADDPDAMWPAVDRALGVGPAAQLQSLGKLYYLTLNNQPLVEALIKATSGNGAAALSSPLELVTRGYYESSAWTPLIAAGSIPPQIPGSSPSEQASNYADLMAAQVRLSYPTAVLADQVRRGTMPISDTAEVASGVFEFLNAQQGEFEIGVEPVEAFIARTGATKPSDGVIAQVKRLQRVYQLTPDDTSMTTLLNHNLDSAYAITRYDPAGFVRAFSTQLGGEDAATAVHARARQVYVSVMSIAAEYLKSRATPTLGGTTPVMYGYPPAPATPPAPVVAYPTLEGLFGSLDYCGCSDCGSMLSPAAYFVDLLHFVDQPSPSPAFDNPQAVLFARRPDLQYLNLTCANTNTSMPYIDIVNETLEYYVANGLSIDGYEGHNTSDDITSAELVASPQYVNDDAYTLLRGTFFPAPLPFNRPLTLLRLQLAAMNINLPAAMQALRANDDITNTTTPTSYGWQDILIEQLGISRDQYRIFTDPSLDLGDLYGLPQPTAAQQVQTLQNTSLQDFSRRLGVSYDDFTAILQTQFINPNAALIPLLEQLDADFQALEQLSNNPTANSAAFIQGLPSGLDATQYGGTTPDDDQAIVGWVTSNYARIADIITLTNTSAGTSDPDYCSGANYFLQYTNPATPDLSGTDFLKLILFIQLWQMLAPLLAESDDAAAIADTDNIVAALYPPAQQPLSTNTDPENQELLNAGFATMLARLGFLVQVMNQLSLSAGISLDQLLACWSDISTLGSDSLYATMFLTPALLQQDPGALTATVSSTVGVGDILTTTINGADPPVSYEVSAGQSAGQVAAAMAVAINASPGVDPATDPGVTSPTSPPGLTVGERYLATADGGVITIKAGFTLACSTSTGATETYAPLAVPADSRVATVGGTPTQDDVLTTTLNGVAVPYTVPAGATLDTIAAGIAAAINAAPATSTDPLSGEPLSQEFSASSSGLNVVVEQPSGTGFTLECSAASVSGELATESYTSQSPVCQTATVGRTVTPGDTLTTTIDTVEVPYVVQPSDTADSVAAGIAAAINATTIADPYSGLPLSMLVFASSFGATVTVLTAGAGAPFTLECTLTPPASGSAGASSYSVAAPTPAQYPATIGGTVKPGDVLTTIINTVTVPYTVVAGDTTTTIAQNIAHAINATTGVDTISGFPLNSIVQASTSAASAGIVTFTATNPSVPVSLICQVSASATETYVAGAPQPESAVATVSGSVPANATITTTINAVPVLYTVQSGESAVSIAQGIADAIANTTVADAISAQPLNQLVIASASAGPQNSGVVTVTAAKPTTTFTIQGAITASGYTAGRQTPPFAANGSGQFLTDPTQTLFAHEPTLCAACNITGAEFQLIAEQLNYTASEPLTLQTVSQMFRYGWLAHTLGLSVATFLALINATGLDPFASLDPGTPPAVQPPVIRYINLLNAISNSGLDANQALYLMWNQDVSGRSAPPFSEIAGLALALRAAFAGVDAAFTLQDDPSGSIAQGLMTLVYGTSATDFFFGLLNNTFTTSVPYSAPPGIASLPQAVLSASSGRLSYNAVTKQLVFAGVLDGATQAAIDAAITVDTTSASSTPAGVATFTPASMTNIYPGAALLTDTGAAQETVVVTATTATTFTADTMYAHNGSATPFPIVNDQTLEHALASVAAANLAAVSPFFATYPELKPLYLAYVASSDPPQTKRTTLLANFLPILVSERKQEQALASVTSTAGSDPSFATALLQDPSILHADADASVAAVTDFTAIEQQGLAAQFFLTNDLDAAADEQAACAPTLAYAQTATLGGTITPGEILTTTIDGVAVPYTVGAFTLACAVSAGATETLAPASQAPGVSQTITVGGTLTAGDTLTATLDGVPIPYTVQATDSTTTIAANLAAAVNGTTVEDPIVGAPLNQVLAASSAANVVTVTVTPGGPSTQPPQIASAIAAAINATTTTVAGVPLSQIAAASATGSTITIAGANLASGGYFSLACSVSGGASTTYTTGTQLPGASGHEKIAAVWSGYLTVSQSGAYDVNIVADPDASLTLEIDGELVLSGVVPAAGLLTNDTEISLVAGQLVPIVLTATSIVTTLAVAWQTQGIGWQEIPGEYLYSSTLVSRLSDTYVRFLKATSLAAALSLAAQEIAYLGTYSGFSVNTTSTTTTTQGTSAFTPASMANIAAGSELVIDSPAQVADPTSGIDSPGLQETVTVSATTNTTFTAVTTNPHGGTSSPYPMVSVARPQLGQGWINALAGAPGDAEQDAANDLTTVLRALLDFARIKQALSPADNRVLTVLQAPSATLPNGQSALLTLTGWTGDSLAALLTQLFPHTGITSLTSVENLARIYDAFALVTASRLAASVLISAITNAPTATTIGTLQSALRSQYAADDWLNAVTPINNSARIAQRDALVAYIVQQQGDRYEALQASFTTTAVAPTGSAQLTVTSPSGEASALIGAGMTVSGSTNIAAGTTVTAVSGDTVTISTGLLGSIAAGSTITFSPPGPAISSPDDLYADLMIDPENQPPVLTSRILLATLTAQLFIERVIRNLEPQVAPADINDSQWAWMKRYRIWQANREVFLWPENWLYPQLRDNQSPIFQTTMSALLQGDIDDDAATNAYLDYLTNFEEVAKLEACGLYYQPPTAGTDETALVVSRTAGARRKYYFRELSSGSWGPWAEAQIDCDDLPLTPIIWNGRLFLFWLKIVKQAVPATLDASTVNEPADTAVASYTIGDFGNLASQTQGSQAMVSIGAVLCWSEYYNGKWQPTKTSDVNFPTSLSDLPGGGGLGLFPAAGPQSFEQSTRPLLRIVPAQFTGTNPLAQDTGVQFTPGPDSLILPIVCAGQTTEFLGVTMPLICGGFMLHNTHSLPVRLDDIQVPASLFDIWTPLWQYLDLPSPSRTLSAAEQLPSGTTPPPPFTGAFDSGTFTITYESTFGAGAIWTNPLLEYSWMPRFTEPQPNLPDAWNAPFIYEDRRNIFYVNTTISARRFFGYDGFGMSANGLRGANQSAQIASLVLRNSVVSPNALANAASQGDPNTIQRHLAQETSLNAALNSSVTITYDGRAIGLTGSLPITAAATHRNGKGA